MGQRVIVVDTNVVSYFLFPGQRTPYVEAVRSIDSDWIVPNLFRHEWLNVVVSYIRQRVFTRDDALRVHRRGLDLVRVDEREADPIRVFNLHLASGCSSYDCEFVEAAQRHGLPLITADQEILQRFPSIAIDPEQFRGS